MADDDDFPDWAGYLIGAGAVLTLLAFCWWYQNRQANKTASATVPAQQLSMIGPQQFQQVYGRQPTQTEVQLSQRMPLTQPVPYQVPYPNPYAQHQQQVPIPIQYQGSPYPHPQFPPNRMPV